MWAQICNKQINDHKGQEDFFAKMDIYNHMAYYVAKKLHLAPHDILDTWSVPALIVAYGQYMNEDSYRNWLTWNDQNKKTRGKEPKKVVVEFINAFET